MHKRVLIIGGGFVGIKTALELAKKSSELEITLVSDLSHFEYHAYLYRVVAGRTPLEVCLPLNELFKNTFVNVVKDTAISIDPQANVVHGLMGSRYHYDTLVLALGSESDFYGIEGFKEFAYTFKTINDAIKLKRHIHEMFEKCSLQQGSTSLKECLVHLVIVGAGASGVELAGELALYTKKIAKPHKIDASMVRIDLIEGSDRVLPSAEPHISAIALARLKSLGVNVLLSKKVVQAAQNKLVLSDGELATSTVVWTAGVKPVPFYVQSGKFQTSVKGQVLVDAKLHALPYSNIYVAGDAAVSKFGGLAQTALHQAKFIANDILNSGHMYVPVPPVFAVPIGAGWAIVKWKGMLFTGKLGWLVRRLFDLKFYLGILPVSKAISAFRQDSVLCETCDICSNS